MPLAEILIWSDKLADFTLPVCYTRLLYSEVKGRNQGLITFPCAWSSFSSSFLTAGDQVSMQHYRHRTNTLTAHPLTLFSWQHHTHMIILQLVNTFRGGFSPLFPKRTPKFKNSPTTLQHIFLLGVKNTEPWYLLYQTSSQLLSTF